MTSPSLLSVVMPTHDRVDSFVRAARSVLDQDVEALELVVVDDASDDATGQAIERLCAQDRRVVTTRNDRSLGPMRARNAGLALARGELVGFCDDDDAWLPGAARTMTEFLGDHPDVGVASSWHLVAHEALGRSVTFRGPLVYDDTHLLWQNVIGLPFGVVRRSAFSFEIAFDPGMRTGEDWDLWLRCAQERPIRSVPAVCYRYAQHGGSRVTRTASEQIEGRRHFVDKHGPSMTTACRLFHRCVLEGLEHGRKATARRLAAEATSAPSDVALVSTALGASYVASHLGVRRRDPGLQARVMVRLIGHDRGLRRRSAPPAGGPGPGPGGA